MANAGGVVADEVPHFSGDFAVGAQVAGYLLREQIGWGGMAAVYRAYEVRLSRWVALKILAPEIASDASFRRRFICESRAAAAVDHPHIIPVFEAGEAGGVLFIAMRYVGGGDVRLLIRRLGPLDAARAGRIIGQVASALDAAHAAGLAHRDVRPANMLLDDAAGDGYPDHVYLADFGLSRQAGPAAGSQADLCALACAAYEMLAGEAAFRRADDLALLGAQLAGAPPPLTSFRSDLPPAVDHVLARAMTGSPDDRYESCRDFAAALLQACGLEWGASGQLLAGSRGTAMPLAAPLAAPLATADLAAARDHAAEPRWPAARPLTPSLTPSLLPAGVAPVPGLASLAAVEPAVTGPGLAAPGSAGPGLAVLGLAPGGPDGLRRDGPGPYPPARRGRSRGRSPVTAVTVLVVILAIAGAAAALLRGGGPAPARQAAPALHSAAASAAGQTGPGRPRQAGRASQAGRSRPSHSGSPGRAIGAASPGASVRPRDAGGRASRASRRGRISRRSRAASARPAATVTAYIAAINRHDYARAWDLGGRHSSSSYAAFVQGFGTTAKDTLIILSVRGGVVTVELVAQQTDGTVKTYQGTYIVDDGIITNSDIGQIS
jgi:tRNA A-37 threonylcarbamoyl transferase component Bud32